MGAIINEETLPLLRALIVAGAANNQLASCELGEKLRARGILYAPDFVINAGGMLNAAGDILGSYDRGSVINRIDEIFELCIEIFERAEAENAPTNLVANRLAQARISHAQRNAVL